MTAVILAGGGGTRLWPLSRNAAPKQVKSFFGKETLLQRTYRRTRKIFSRSDMLVATNISHLKFIKRQLPLVTPHMLSIEPAKRDTAAAIGLAAVRVAARNPRGIMMTVNADHMIIDERVYAKTVRLAERVVRKHPDHSVLLGIEPTYPETGYGYIKLTRKFSVLGGRKIYQADRFIEKPPLAKARQYVKRWEYLWNPAMFVWRVDHLLNLYRRYLPQQYRILMRIQSSIGTARERQVIAREYPRMQSISIDYGIMEKERRMLVIPAGLGWADIGHWRTVHEMLDSDPVGNTVRGKHVGISTRNSLIMNFTDRLVATAGVQNLVVVQTDDATLVCDREHAQEVKHIVELIKKKKWLKYL